MCQQLSAIGDLGADELADLVCVSPAAAEADELVDDRLAHVGGGDFLKGAGVFEAWIMVRSAPRGVSRKPESRFGLGLGI